MRRTFLLTVVALLVLSAAPALPAAEIATCFGETATIAGDAGDNVLMGTPGDDVIDGGGGNDTIDGMGGNDLICGGVGNDTIAGGPGHDLILGGAGADTIDGQGGMDALSGLKGNDELFGRTGRDVLVGNRGNDDLMGGNGGDHIEGNLGAADLAKGGAQIDWCTAETELSCEGPHGPFRLKANGIGNIPFGTPTDTALVELALMGDPEMEGAPDEDSGWIDSFSIYGTCPNDEVRMVRWGNVRTFFTRTGLTEGEFFTWQVVGFGGYIDKKLATPNGLRLGDTRGQLELLYKAVDVSFIEPFGFWHFYTQNNLSGITGTLSDGTYGAEITFLQGGIGCGE